MSRSGKSSQRRSAKADRARRRQMWAKWGCGGLTAAALVGLIALQFVPTQPDPDGPHGHPPAPHGGLVVPIGTGKAHYHAEVVIGPTGAIDLYTLGPDPYPPIPVDPQHLVADVLPAEGPEAVPVALRPAPESGPPDGPTARFRGRLPPDLLGQKLSFRVPELLIDGERFTFDFDWQSALSADEHAARVADEQRRLYLTAGGRYTGADVRAAGGKTAVERYRGFRVRRLVRALPGDRVCPVTRMKADDGITWTVGGGEYRFCCPVCIDDFVLKARERPDEIKAPGEYVK